MVAPRKRKRAKPRRRVASSRIAGASHESFAARVAAHGHFKPGRFVPGVLVTGHHTTGGHTTGRFVTGHFVTGVFVTGGRAGRSRLKGAVTGEFVPGKFVVGGKAKQALRKIKPAAAKSPPGRSKAKAKKARRQR